MLTPALMLTMTQQVAPHTAGSFKHQPPHQGRNSSLVVFGLAVHSVAGLILLWGHFPVEGIFPLELTWVQTPFPQKLFRMRL